MSKNVILENIDKPEFLEEVYRNSPSAFESDLKKAIEIKSDSETLKVWHARLSYLPLAKAPTVSVVLLVLLCLIAGFLVKLPSILPIDADWYYPRFVPLITILSIIAYFLISMGNKDIVKWIISATSVCVLFLLFLPSQSGSASITMSLIHLPLFVFSLLAVSFMSDQWRSVEARISFIRYVGETGIYTVVILLGGMVLTALTIGLFSLIDLSIGQWYMEYIVVLGLVSSPLVATYLFDAIQRRESKFAPILSNVFSPLFLITVLAYLMATFYQGQSPFTDRDFLITFNGLLIVILVLTIFSISGKKRTVEIELSDYINVFLIGATLVINLVALSAILFRWAEYGSTVNRIVVTGANILIFVHLSLLLFSYIGHIRNAQRVSSLESVIAGYLPVYTAWSFVVAIVLPFLYQFE